MNTPRVELPLQLRPASGAAPAVLPVRRGPDQSQQHMRQEMWTEAAIALALEGRFYLTDGKDRNTLLREAEEKRQRQRAELIRQRTRQMVEEVVVVNGPTDPSSIISVVAHAHAISTADMLSRSRAQHIIRARQHACVLLRELAQLPLSAIAKAVNLKDHSTAIHSCKTWARHARRYAEADAQARKMLGVA